MIADLVAKTQKTNAETAKITAEKRVQQPKQERTRGRS